MNVINFSVLRIFPCLAVINIFLSKFHPVSLLSLETHFSLKYNIHISLTGAPPRSKINSFDFSNKVNYQWCCINRTTTITRTPNIGTCAGLERPRIKEVEAITQ